jgi:hypothetical protein
MPYGILADIVVWVHLTFVIFAVLGAVLILWRRWMIWLHIPAFLWAIWIEFSSGICPLTPLENWLRVKAGQGAYEGEFVAAYLMPILYPAGLTRKIQIILAMMLIGINVAIYGFVAFKGSWKSTKKNMRSIK